MKIKAMSTDPIADLLTRIRNAELARHDQCYAPYSRIKEEILKILVSHKYITAYKAVEDAGKKYFDISLVTGRGYKTYYKRVSKPGQRIYVQAKEIRPVQNGLGIAIYSTSKGLLDNVQAKEQSLGGELLCEVW